MEAIERRPDGIAFLEDLNLLGSTVIVVLIGLCVLCLGLYSRVRTAILCTLLLLSGTFGEHCSRFFVDREDRVTEEISMVNEAVPAEKADERGNDEAIDAAFPELTGEP